MLEPDPRAVEDPRDRNEDPRYRDGREPDQRHADSACVEHDGARPVEHTQVVMYREQGIRDAALFVVAWHEQDRHSGRRKTLEWRECRFGQPRGHVASVEQVAAVDDDIDSPCVRAPGRARHSERSHPPSVPGDARPGRPIETDVRVRYEQHTHVTPTRVRRRAEHRQAPVQHRSAAPRGPQPPPGA
jgi:hypothetical protein